MNVDGLLISITSCGFPLPCLLITKAFTVFGRHVIINSHNSRGIQLFALSHQPHPYGTIQRYIPEINSYEVFNCWLISQSAAKFDKSFSSLACTFKWSKKKVVLHGLNPSTWFQPIVIRSSFVRVKQKGQLVVTVGNCVHSTQFHIYLFIKKVKVKPRGLSSGHVVEWAVRTSL